MWSSLTHQPYTSHLIQRQRHHFIGWAFHLNKQRSQIRIRYWLHFHMGNKSDYAKTDQSGVMRNKNSKAKAETGLVWWRWIIFVLIISQRVSHMLSNRFRDAFAENTTQATEQTDDKCTNNKPKNSSQEPLRVKVKGRKGKWENFQRFNCDRNCEVLCLAWNNQRLLSLKQLCV